MRRICLIIKAKALERIVYETLTCDSPPTRDLFKIPRLKNELDQSLVDEFSMRLLGHGFSKS